MSIKVSDCLKLTSLRESNVIAGHKGLDSVVSAVSVLEYADCSVLADGLFIGNEIVITAFASIKDDIDEQCKVIRRLHEVGEVGVILYYVGIFIPEVSPRLIEVAEELDFPLICMPTNRFDFRYSDVIGEIYELIIKNEIEETYFVSDMIDRIAQLQEFQRNIDTVLRMLSDRLRCTLLLANHRGEYLSSAAWPMADRWDYKSILIETNQLLMNRDSVPRDITLNGHPVHLRKSKIDIENQLKVEMIAIDESGRLKRNSFIQALEVIQLFISIWKYDFGNEGKDALVQAIIRDEPARMRYIANALNFDIESISIMWILKETDGGLSDERLNNANKKRIILARMFLQEHRKLALVDIYDGHIIILMNRAINAEEDNTLCEAFMKLFQEKESSLVLVTYKNLNSTIEARESYFTFEKYFESANKIYPKHCILGEHKLKFAQNCTTLVAQGEREISHITELLNPLLSEEDDINLVETLSVFLLDSQKSMEKTGLNMYIHKNTVKYRINKIKQRVGYDLNKMPESYVLYQAVAIKRLLNMN